MTRQAGDAYHPEYFRQGSPAAGSTVGETVPRWATGADLTIAASGVELAVALPLQAGDVVTNCVFVTGGTAAGTPTAGYAVLRDPAGNKLVQTADFGSTARAANTAFSVAMTAPFTIVIPGLYIMGISFTATTVPTLRGVQLNNAVLAGAVFTGAKILSQSHGSAVGATAPTTISSPTTQAVIPYLVAT